MAFSFVCGANGANGAAAASARSEESGAAEASSTWSDRGCHGSPPLKALPIGAGPASSSASYSTATAAIAAEEFARGLEAASEVRGKTKICLPGKLILC